MSTFAAKKLLRKYSMLLEQSVYVYIVFVIAYTNARKNPVCLCKNALRLQSCKANFYYGYLRIMCKMASLG